MADNTWEHPAAMAIPKEGYFKLEQGRYGPIFPRTPACYGFTIFAKIIPGREPVFYEYAKKIETAVAADSRLSRRPQAPLPSLGLYSCQRSRPTSCIRASLTPTSTSTPKMQSACSTNRE